MPLNRATDIKSLVTWLLVILKTKEREKALNRLTDAEQTNNALYDQSIVSSNAKVKPLSVPLEVPVYVPGLLLVPIPEAGPIFGYIDMAFWAAFLYFFGSVVYMIDSFYVWGATYEEMGDDALNPGNYLNTLAAVLFVANALFCIVDWWLQYKQLSALNLSADELTGGLLLEEVPIRQSIYYFFNNLFFMAAAVVYMVESIWMENVSLDHYNCLDGL